MNVYGKHIANLIGELSRLPSIGQKSAVRLAFHIINMEDKDSGSLVSAIVEAKQNIKKCEICCAITDVTPCAICSNIKRNKEVIMIVEDVRDMAAYEKTKEFKGLYHVLGGSINPALGISPDMLNFKELIKRLGDTKEVIVATNPTIEGEATAMYLKKIIGDIVKVTRIAHGIPVGGNLEYVDEVTLARALEGRREL